MTLKRNELTKILIVIVVLIFLLMGMVVMRLGRKTPLTNEGADSQVATEAQGSMVVQLTINEAEPGERLKADVKFNALGSKVYGADAVIRFDPNYLEVDEELEQGYFFAVYPRAEVDNSTGTIHVTGISPKDNDPLTDEKLLFTVYFVPKKAGQTEISLEFQPGATNLSTLVEYGTSKNILGSVTPASLIIKED